MPSRIDRLGGARSEKSTDADTAYVLIWPGRAIYVGPLLGNQAHAHHALQISIALGEALSIQAAPDRRWRSFRAVATASDQSHRLRGRGPIAQIYLDPESAAGLAVRQSIGDAPLRPIDIDDVEMLADALRSDSDGRLDADRVVRIVDDIAGGTTPDFSRDLVDPRIQRTLTTIHSQPGRHVSVRALADEVALSPNRLGALFRRDIGIPIRRYQLWLRLIDAIEALSSGITLTEAAYRVGFSDSAHLTRTFHRMFGMPPSALHVGHVEVHDLAAGAPAMPWWARTSVGTGAGGPRSGGN